MASREITKEKALKILDSLLIEGKKILENFKHKTDESAQWIQSVHVTFERFFEKDSRPRKELYDIENGPCVFSLSNPDEGLTRKYLSDLQNYTNLISATLKSIESDVIYFPSEEDLRNSTSPNRRVFIGHGRSRAWKDLQEFIEKRLKLEVVEFNTESTAGYTTKERLEEMVDGCGFAFLVMTAEDAQVDGSVRTRENVVHEIGLFQGRLGFRRAIIMLEEGCQEFSNIVGINQIRFASGQIESKTEEIRKVLEREGFIEST